MMVFRERERGEAYVQQCSPYMFHLQSMVGVLDDWLARGVPGPPPKEAYEFAEHPWCYRFLSRSARNRLSRVRLAIEDWNGLDDNRRPMMFQHFDEMEIDANRKKPICAICLYDLRNDAFEMMVTDCGHCLHRHCLVRWFENDIRCPVCVRQTTLADCTRIFLSYTA